MSKPETLELATMPQNQAVEPSIGSMLQQVVSKGITPENATALKELTALYVQMQDREAKKDAVSALMAFQTEAKKIVATREVPDKQGRIKYKTAPFEDIMKEVQPLATRHGFVIAFGSDINEGRITKICKLTHISGHTFENSFTVRIGSGPYGASETQADMAAHTSAKRGALCDALNIVIGREGDDEGAEGASITAEQAESLERRVKETGSDPVRFLKFAGADSYDKIPSSMLGELDALLAKREGKN